MLFFGFIVSSLAAPNDFMDYTDRSLIDCNDIKSEKEYKSNKDLYRISNNLILHEIDRYAFLILGTIGGLFTIFIIYPYFSKRFHLVSDPDGSKILLAISFTEIFLVSHWISHGIYGIFINEGIRDTDPFC